MAGEITRQEFNDQMNRLYDALSRQSQAHDQKYEAILVQVTTVITKFNSLKMPKQPCDKLTEHLADHKDVKMTWMKAIAGWVVAAIAAGVVAVINLMQWVKNTPPQ